MKMKMISILIVAQSMNYYTMSQENNLSSDITIYVITSCSPIDWSNPSKLFKSLNICYINAALRKNYYIIGHTIVRINSPLLSKPLFIAMSGVSKTEKLELVFIKKLGLGALGATIQGHIESEASIKKGIKLYTKRGNIAFIKFLIAEKSVERALKFVEYYQKPDVNNFFPAKMYNGALYPRYENEGSGCSAFGITLLDIANILPSDAKNWCVNLKLPMNLIGGEFNDNKKINPWLLYKTKNWYNDNGKEGIEYVNHKMYDPSIIFKWIINKRLENDSIFKPIVENEIGGLVVDKRHIIFDVNAPILLQRKDSDVFIKQYHYKIKSLNTNQSN